MFKILGADGREYGPVAVDQIKKWIAEGRANRETMAQQTGDSNWKSLGQFAEFADVFGGAPPPAAVTPPPAATVPASPAAAPAGGAPGGADARARALQLVTAPAIGLMVVAGLGIASTLFGLAVLIAGGAVMPELPGLDPEFARIIRTVAFGPVGILIRVINLAIYVLILVGALRMQKLTGYGLVMTAAIIAMIPCFTGPCCLLGLPFGIWALVVMNKPEVKSQFN